MNYKDIAHNEVRVSSMICRTCGHVFIDELVEVCQCGHGDNLTEYVVCPECGNTQRVLLTEVMTTSKREMSRV